jgi:hypothetical protein
MGQADFKKEGRCSDQRNALPKGDPAALPKGDRADVTRFTRGAVLKLSPLLFTINEPGPALTSLVNRTPTTFRS